jgi:hypothetical protein
MEKDREQPILETVDLEFAYPVDDGVKAGLSVPALNYFI